jgi:1,4-dihydroxy-2-naphthoate polyprenyltransferase
MKVKYWIKAARLRTLPLALSCILMGSGLSLAINNTLNLLILSLCISTTLLLQVLSNFANDYGDGIKGSDQFRENADRMVQQGLISKKSMLFGIIICSVLCFFSGCLLLYTAFDPSQYIIVLGFLILGLLAIAASIKYTVGKSAYGYHGLGDLFVFIFFGIVGVIGSFYLLSNTFNLITILGSLYTGCMSVAVLNMNNMRDYESDSRVNKNTLVVKIGVNKAKIYHAFLIIISISSYSLISFRLDNKLILFGLLPCLILLSNLKKVFSIKKLQNLDSELKKIALVSFFSCLWIIVVYSYF